MSQNLKKYVLISSIQDSRFPPIQKKDFDQLTVCLSFLHNFEPEKEWDDWEIGVHGIEIFLDLEDDYFSGTFLPEVAHE